MESGASAHETRDALGHSNLTMTNQYLSTSGIGLARAYELAHADQSVKNSSSPEPLNASETTEATLVTHTN